ncbi:MAG: TetR/AcrR family transcriptional regulator [Kangiellaceae bacterium]|jgi:AcrR family transcriptional regulator
MNQTRQQAALATKQKIIQAAFEIVGEAGYEALTTNLLISKAGVAKGTLYHHFSNLDDVVYAMIESIFDQSLEDVPVENYRNINDYMEAIGQYIMKDFTQNPCLMNTVFGFIPKGMKDPFFESVAQKMLENACQRIAPAIQRFYAGKVDEQRIDNAIRMVDMFGAGFCIHYSIFADNQKYQVIWKDFSDMLAKYLEQ